MSDHEQVLSQAHEAVRARGGTAPVPELRTNNPLWLRAQLAFLRKVVGPLRRRRPRDPLPAPLSGEETAQRLFSLPVSYWSYDWEPGVRHLGPMSQDFSATFGLGSFTRRIHMVDANGVAVVAIQSLHRSVTRLEAEVSALRAKVAELEDTDGATNDVSASGQTDDPAPAIVEVTGTSPGTHREVSTMDENTSRPSEDDVEAHRLYGGSDRTIKDEIEPVTWDGEDGDDVEGHRSYSSSDRTIKDQVDPVTWDGEDGDVEGHRFHNSDQSIKDDIAPVTWNGEDGDDVEGHRFSSSDRTIKDEVEPVTWDGDADTEGHRYYSSDQTIKDDVDPVTWDGEKGEDTEGHRFYSSDQTIKDDVAPVAWEGEKATRATASRVT